MLLLALAGCMPRPMPDPSAPLGTASATGGGAPTHLAVMRRLDACARAVQQAQQGGAAAASEATACARADAASRSEAEYELAQPQ